MGNNTPSRSAEQFPFVPVLILLFVFGGALFMFLAGQPQLAPQTRPVVTVRPTATEIVPTAVAVAPVEVTAEAAPVVEGEATADAAAAGAETSAVAVSYDPQAVSLGSTLFMANCSACHGMNALGVQGLGKNLLDSEFMDSLTDDELIVFIQTGRQPFDPANTTGVAMPAYGGNPTLSEIQLFDIVAWLRTNALHPERIVANGGQAFAGDAPAGDAAATEEAASDVTQEPFVLPADRLGIRSATATPTPEPFVLPGDRLGIRLTTPTPTPGQ